MKIGCYYIAHYPNQARKRIKDLPRMWNMGIKQVFTPIAISDRDFLDRCIEIGMGVVAEFNGEPEDIWQAFPNYPFEGVIMQDDINKHERWELEAMRDRLKAIFPGITVYGSTGDANDKNIDVPDIGMMQIYPHPSQHPVDDPIYSLTRILKIRSDVWANPQCFSWTPFNEGLPSPETCVAIAATCIIMGSPNLVWYTFFDSNTDLENMVEHKKAIGWFNRKVDRWRHYINHGQRIRKTVGNTEVAYFDLGVPRQLMLSVDRESLDVRIRLVRKV